MRTLAHLPSKEKRRRIALETLEIYGPLARRIGMEKMARELESLAFHEAFPEAEAAINARLEQLRVEKGQNVAIIVQTIMEVFEFAGIDARVFGREKLAQAAAQEHRVFGSGGRLRLPRDRQ
jgi:GTP pyrophosphokinase/guanosine-3',5'-bis(diphosphate) 3'-pyrophosphohydrolase